MEMDENDFGPEGAGFVADEDRADFECSKCGEKLPFTWGHIRYDGRVRCPRCGQVGPPVNDEMIAIDREMFGL